MRRIQTNSVFHCRISAVNRHQDDQVAVRAVRGVAGKPMPRNAIPITFIARWKPRGEAPIMARVEMSLGPFSGNRNTRCTLRCKRMSDSFSFKRCCSSFGDVLKKPAVSRSSLRRSPREHLFSDTFSPFRASKYWPLSAFFGLSSTSFCRLLRSKILAVFLILQVLQAPATN